MKSTTISYIVHILAGVLIVAIPLLIAGIPQSVQAMTIAGALGAILKLAHDAVGL